jgi:uncharacterized membrane protein YkvA (DUF1232 family)
MHLVLPGQSSFLLACPALEKLVKTLVKQAVRRHRPWDVVRFAAHLPSFARLFLRLLGDSRVSLFAKGLLLGSVIYVFSPLDFLPDIMPLLGQVDDLALLAMGCRMFIQLAPRPVVEEHIARIDSQWKPFGEG